MCVAQRDVENRGVALDIDTARQARDLGAVGAKQDHRRVTHDAEVLALLLRARCIAIEIDRHEQLRALLELAPVEDRGLDLRAGRAPLSAPVEVQRLVRRLGRREGGLHVAGEPVDTGGMMGVSLERGALGGGRRPGLPVRAPCGRTTLAEPRALRSRPGEGGRSDEWSSSRLSVRPGEMAKGYVPRSPWQRRRPAWARFEAALPLQRRHTNVGATAPRRGPWIPDVVRSRIAGQGHPLRVSRELRHRRDQGRRGDLHELRQHARRGDPLGRRLPEPGAAVHRAAARRAAADDAASARLRQVQLFLELHRRADAVQHGRAVLDLRGLAQAAEPRGAQQGLGRARWFSVSRSRSKRRA